MFKKPVFILLTKITLIIVFLYFAFLSWNKFIEMRISTEVIENRVNKMVYPSVTVCPEKTLKLTELPSLRGNLENAKDIWRKSTRKGSLNKSSKLARIEMRNFFNQDIFMTSNFTSRIVEK